MTEDDSVGGCGRRLVDVERRWWEYGKTETMGTVWRSRLSLKYTIYKRLLVNEDIEWKKSWKHKVFIYSRFLRLTHIGTPQDRSPQSQAFLPYGSDSHSDSHESGIKKYIGTQPTESLHEEEGKQRVFHGKTVHWTWLYFTIKPHEGEVGQWCVKAS